ncbi:ArsR/SmtB family transcription factor [Sphingomonas paucimobilis]|uniref:ArsR/SmtB family transcription factor n=1 Tax=Sphingomonas paucimobilis TaxID=13689 RepID=UPI0015FFB471|nr:hypothetical protein [Sphingomonas paucimobilis]
MSLDPIRADVMVERLKMPAQPHRLTIGLTSLNGARAVGEIEAVAGIGQPAPSRQPVELHRADLVRPRQEARRIFYKMGSGAIEDPIAPFSRLWARTGLIGICPCQRFRLRIAGPLSAQPLLPT